MKRPVDYFTQVAQNTKNVPYSAARFEPSFRNVIQRLQKGEPFLGVQVNRRFTSVSRSDKPFLTKFGTRLRYVTAVHLVCLTLLRGRPEYPRTLSSDAGRTDCELEHKPRPDGGGRKFAVAPHVTRPQLQFHAAPGDVTVHPLAVHCGALFVDAAGRRNPTTVPVPRRTW